MESLAENRRARFDYTILETYEVGVELLGGEVKSIKNGHINLSGSYAVLRDGELWLLNAEITPYQPKNMREEYDGKRSRRLLMHKSEIRTLLGRLHEKGLSLLPLKVYLKKNRIKIELGLGKSRKKHDKREMLKKRTAQREMRREK